MQKQSTKLTELDCTCSVVLVFRPAVAGCTVQGEDNGFGREPRLRINAGCPLHGSDPIMPPLMPPETPAWKTAEEIMEEARIAGGDTK
ncbi:MAG: hypothetical protein WAN65_17840 [Candidatus Sulfotelmatobacter sp.]